MREMKDSGVEWIGKIPKDWTVVKLKNIKDDIPYAIVDGPFGTAISTNDYVDEGVPLIRIININQPGLTEDNLIFITEEHAESIRRSSIHKGDIVFAKTGATVGKCAINDKFDYGIMSSSCVKISISSDCDNRYYYYFFYTDQFQNELRNACAGTTRDTINLQPFSNLRTVLPLPKEQHKIADYLDVKCSKIDEIIAKQEQIIEKLKEYKISVITEAVTKGLNPDVEMKDSGIEWIGSIPSKWTTIKLKSIIDCLPGYAFSSDDFEQNNGIPLLRGINLTPNGIRWDDTVYWNSEITDKLNQFLIRENDIVVGLDRPWVSDGMRVTVIRKEDLPCLLLQRVCRIRVKEPHDFRLVYHWINSKAFESALSIETTGVSVPHISTKQIENFAIAVPSSNEEKTICDYLDSKCKLIDEDIRRRFNVIDKAIEYKKSLIYEIVTGKKEV